MDAWVRIRDLPAYAEKHGWPDVPSMLKDIDWEGIMPRSHYNYQCATRLNEKTRRYDIRAKVPWMAENPDEKVHVLVCDGVSHRIVVAGNLRLRIYCHSKTGTPYGAPNQETPE